MLNPWLMNVKDVDDNRGVDRVVFLFDVYWTGLVLHMVLL